MKISEINITPVKPTNGLIAFASCLLNDRLYLGSIGIMTKLDGTYRLTYPTKKLGLKDINIFYPINKETGSLLEKEIIKKFKEVMKKGNDRHHQVGTATKHVHHH